MKQTHKQSLIITAALIAITIPTAASAKENETIDQSSSGRQTSRSGADVRSNSTIESTTETQHTESKSSASSEIKRQSDKSTEDNRRQLNQEIQTMRSEDHQAQATIENKTDKKLDDTKKKICDGHESKINSIMDAMDKRRQTAYDRITNVFTSAQAYYMKQKLTIDNYDSLLSAVTNAQTAAAAAKNEQLSSAQFDCNSSKPHTDLELFKQKRKGSIDAMKVYRDAVKKYLSAVKAASSQKESTN